jgi:hypothetical protein
VTKLGHFLAVLGVSAAIGPAGRAEEVPPVTGTWTPEQAMRIVERATDREPFLASREAGLRPDSLGHFFIRPDYAILRGNPVYGYWAEGTFAWVGDRVAWDGVRAASPSARPITPRAWTAAFKYVAEKHGLTIDRNAPIRVWGACIGAVLDPNLVEPNRGVVLEVRVDSPTGPLLYRFGMGKPTIEDAVGASLDWAVGFALTVNHEPNGTGRQAR